MRRNTARIVVGGQPACWLGANFWSRTGGPLMWRSYDPDVIREELRVLRAHGLTMTRSFFYWPDFMPEPDAIDEDMAARFADFLNQHADQDMSTVPTFIVGHMSGQNWDPPWRAGRDLYSDVWMVGRQTWFAGEMVRRFGPHPAVAGWLVSNEMPLYGGDQAPPETVAAWAQMMRDAVRAAGGRQPFSLGDGAWGIEATGRENGFRLADAAAICDFLGPHIYPVGDDQIRQHYAAAWQCELAGTFGRPVVLEEFGVSSDFAAEENAARYYRHVLHHSLLAGATGWIAWNNTDFDLPGQDPYRHHAFEQHFGLTDAAGQPKATLREMQAFAATLDEIKVTRCARPDTDAALIVPSYLDTGYPFTDPADREHIARTLAQAYVSARLADLPVALTRETSGIGQDARLYLAPSVKQLLAPTGAVLERLAAGGACVYVSYSPGDTTWHRGPSYGRLNEMFGIRHKLDVGLSNPVEDDVVEVPAEPGLRRSGQRDHAQLRCGGRPAQPRVPPGRARRRTRGRRGAGHRCPRPARAAAAPDRAGLARAVHLPGRAHGRADPAGQPGRHGDPLRRAGPARRGAAPGHRGRSPGGLRHADPRRRRAVRRPGQPRRRAAHDQASTARRRRADQPWWQGDGGGRGTRPVRDHGLDCDRGSGASQAKPRPT